MKCTRCLVNKDSNCFLPDAANHGVCRICYTDEELNEYIIPEISKCMKGLKAKEKKAVIKSLLLEHKHNTRTANVQL
jgi:hypothetical protein